MTNSRKKAGLIATSALVSSAILSPAVVASPGTLSQSPLFLSNSVEPNILFTLDDSGSMDWGLMTQEDSGVVVERGWTYYYTLPAADNDYFWIVPDESALTAAGALANYPGWWRPWNKDYNALYYDPTVTYVPWPGENEDNVPYTNSVPTAALIDPWDPDAGTIDLTSDVDYDTAYVADDNIAYWLEDNIFHPARYFIWTDTDDDGVVDPGDGRTLVEIVPATATYTGGIDRRDCAAAPDCTYAEEIQNFANWFTYYRKREHVAKAAYGQVIALAQNSRMGLVTLHNNNSNNIAIASMNADPNSGAKDDLLENLYDFQSANGTPLRTTLDNAGKYLGCTTNSFFTSCPALPDNSGGECQQNFNILMTDGFYNGTFTGVGNADGDDDTEWDSGTAGPYGDATPNTMADIAMEYYENDLRPGTDDNLRPAPGGVDNNEEQHMVTYSVAFGVDGDITDMPTDNTSPFAWPVPAGDPLAPENFTNAQRIDDLRHAAWNGRGEFFSAQNPRQLITSLRGALSSIQSRIGSAAAVAFNSGSLSTNSEVYLALFNSERWSGNLLAYTLDAATGDVSSTPKWRAANRLNARNLSTSPRKILTYDGTDGIPFQWSSLTTAQKTDLRTNPSGSQDDEVVGIARHAYLRGDRGCEISSGDACSHTDGTDTFTSKQFRERAGRLGDIVHSGPVFVGAPESNWRNIAPFPSASGETYNEFRQAQASRPGIVYVGANDGKLHGFNQSNGDEAIAYVPGSLFSSAANEGLHYLTDPAYVHKYYVDLTPSVADTYIKTAPTGSASWRTVLVGGLRGGGRALFALDVTDPNAFSESGAAPAKTVLWEFTSTDDADLGYTFSKPSIVPLAGPSNTIRWAAVFGNGYNDLGSGEAKLFILFLEEGLDGTWSSGDYLEITTGSGNTTTRNGLSTPAVIDSDGDGLADRVYAGDLFGEMWAFDLSGSNTTNWKVAYDTSGTPKPLFTAPANQQITSVPVIVRNKAVSTSTTNAPNTLVIFGTGQYLATADITTTNTQAVYGIWDSGTKEIAQANLREQDIGYGSNTDGDLGRTLTDKNVNYTSKKGWFMELPDSGERQITSPVIRGDLVFFNTMTPDSNPCNYGGTGWQMVAKWVNGGRPDEVSFDFNNDGDLDAEDEISGDAAAGTEITGLPTFPVNLANKRYTATTETTGGDSIVVTDIIDLGGARTGRLSWEELTP